MMSEKGPTKGTSKALPEVELYTLTDLEQVKVLADPLRIRVLEALCDGDRTTKQVADALGERPTKLYHHVEALERVGLIRLTRTRRNRGTLEKYFVAVARRFKTDPRIFSAGEAPSEEESEALQSMISTVYETTADEVRRLVSTDGLAGLDEQGVVSFLELRASEAEIRKLRARFKRLVEEIAAKCCTDEPTEEGARRYRLNIAFYPLDKGPES
jgi:DNA-binding transcriptional ArsR family regulator